MREAAEKRRFNRFDFQKSVKVFPVLPSKSGNIYEVQKNSVEVRSSNISEGGVRLETDKPLDPHFLLKLSFEVGENQPVEVYGKIIWSENKRCGVRFMLADPVLRKGIRSIAQKKTSQNN